MKKIIPSISHQKIFLFGEVHDSRIDQWFKGSWVIEHDLEKLDPNGFLGKVMMIAEVTGGVKVTKMTEVITGSTKGLSFAKLSGSYPLIISQNTPYERGLLTRIVHMLQKVQTLDQLGLQYKICAEFVENFTLGMKCENSLPLSFYRKHIYDFHCVMMKSSINIAKKNFRRLII